MTINNISTSNGLKKDEQIQIPQYKIFKNDGTANSGSILIAIKKTHNNSSNHETQVRIVRKCNTK